MEWRHKRSSLKNMRAWQLSLLRMYFASETIVSLLCHKCLLICPHANLIWFCFCEATIYKFNFGKCKINCEQCFLCFLQCVLHLKENLFNSCGKVYSHVRMTILRIQNSNIVKSVIKTKKSVYLSYKSSFFMNDVWKKNM